MKDSFDLKLDRAEHHLKELNREIRRFADRHSYEAVPVAGTNRKTRDRKFKLRFTGEPSEYLPVIVGDVLHNVRSALDHLVVANVPSKRRRKAGFPIFTTSPFDDVGQVRDNEVGVAWTKLTTGLKNSLLTQVEMLQPYQMPDRADVIAFCVEHRIEPRDLHALGMLSRFDNADKHRELLTVPHGLRDYTVTTRIGNRRPAVDRVPGTSFCENGAVIVAIPVMDIPPNAKVEVQVSGTPVVAIEVGKEHGVTGLPGTLDNLISHARLIVESFRRHGGR